MLLPASFNHLSTRTGIQAYGRVKLFSCGLNIAGVLRMWRGASPEVNSWSKGCWGC